VNLYRDQLISAGSDQIQHAQQWVDDQFAGGGTAIHTALTTAMDMRTNDAKRMFTVVFLTDGQPTIGETNTEKILADVKQKNTEYTRIFTLGVGDNLNAVFMDQIAEQTRALSRYIRPGENVETNVASFFNKINHPVLANLALHTGNNVRLVDLYPPQLPDLFHGDQLVVLARFQGAGHAAIILNGEIGKEPKQFVYEIEFEEQTDRKPFVEELWARRKVGYLLDQIRTNGEKKELVDEVVRLAKNYAITTPYTSYLIMPDAPVEIASSAGGRDANGYAVPAALAPQKAGDKKARLADFAKSVQRRQGELAGNRGSFQDHAFRKLDELNKSKPAADRATKEARQRVLAAQQLKGTLDLARGNYQSGKLLANQVNKQGVDLAVCTNNLKCQSQLQAKAVLRVASRNCMEIGGVWIDEEFTAKTPTLSVKAQSEAYFHILERQPQMKHVFRLGNHVVWIAPNGVGLVIDSTDGIEKISDKEINSLFASK
jgi:Ca-activated chloride channel family protein